VKVAALCGGTGAARLLRGLQEIVPGDDLVAITNVGDDCELHGLAISPDLDTITYTVTGQVNPTTGWGRAGESWATLGSLRRFSAVVPEGSSAGGTWFALGDQDLATHLYRTGRAAEGAPLSTISAEVAQAFGVRFRLVPATDDRLRTRVVVEGDELDFQTWFVGRGHEGRVDAVHYEGAVDASPAPGVLESLAEAERLVVCPSNPIVSIGPILAIPAVADALRRRRADAVAVSPIIAGAALNGPAADLLRDLGHDPSVVGVAHAYRHVAATLVIDEADRHLIAAVEAEGVRCVVAPIVMHDLAASIAVARVALTC